MISAMRAYHKGCIECHNKMKKGPKGCTDCHKVKRRSEIKGYYILNDIPNGIYGSVTFFHKKHIDRDIECGKCHHPGKKPEACKRCHTKPFKNRLGLKGSYHNKCLVCHIKMRVKYRCLQCHKRLK